MTPQASFPVLDALQMDINLPAPSEPSVSAKRISGKFLRGPIPWNWLTTAAQLPGRALHVAIGIWHLEGFEQSGVVRLKPSTLRDLGVDRFAAYRGLKTLEDYELVAVSRRRGAAPLVTILR